MTLERVLAMLEAMGLAENRALYARHGVTAPSYGVAFGHLRDVARHAGTSPPLAEALWATGNHDARILATLVVGERGRSEARLRAWGESLDSAPLTDLFARWAWRAAAAGPLAAAWIGGESEWPARAGWMIHALRAVERHGLTDAACRADLARIERSIHRAPNRARDAMNMALIAIGVGRPALTETALSIARRIGTVEVEWGGSGAAWTPAEAAIRDGVARRARQESGRSGGRAARKR